MSLAVLVLAATADVLLIHGRVHTLDPGRPEATALALAGDRLLAVGSEGELRRLAGPDTRVLDLGGRTVLPGLIDTHTHAFDATRNRVLGWLDLGLPAVASREAAVRALAQRCAAAPPGAWVLGDRWDETKWSARRYLRAADLDQACPGRPVYLEHVSGHAAAVSSAALKRAGVTTATPDPTGGAIEREGGAPTGVLKDTAMDLVIPQLPPSGLDGAQRVEVAARVSAEAAAVGLTTLHEAALPPEGMRAYQEAEAAGRLKIGIRANPLVPAEGTEAALAGLRQMGVHTGHGSAHLKWGAVKFFTDGGMAARTIAVTPPGPLAAPDDLGLLRWETPRLTAAFREVHQLGWQITAHAIGDRAIAQVLEALESALGPDPGDHRSRIVHCGLTTPALLDRIKRQGVLVDHNPPFVHWIGGFFRYYGPERAQAAYRGRSYEAHGIVVSGGSDVSVTPLSPWWGIWAAVERREYGTGEVLGPDERVEVGTALRWYTVNGAYAGFEEGEKGSLNAGKRADLIVLDRDPLAVPAAALKDVRVLATFAGGEIVHLDPGLGWPAAPSR